MWFTPHSLPPIYLPEQNHDNRLGFSPVSLLGGKGMSLPNNAGKPGKKSTLPPPPRENITKIIRPEYFCVIFGGGYGKIA